MRLCGPFKVHGIARRTWFERKIGAQICIYRMLSRLVCILRTPCHVNPLLSKLSTILYTLVTKGVFKPICTEQAPNSHLYNLTGILRHIFYVRMGQGVELKSFSYSQKILTGHHHQVYLVIVCYQIV